MIEAVETQTGIFEFESPQTVETGAWASDHLDCDAIIDNLGGSIVVYAYTREPRYNGALRDLRKTKYNKQKILRGISSDGLNSLV